MAKQKVVATQNPLLVAGVISAITLLSMYILMNYYWKSNVPLSPVTPSVTATPTSTPTATATSTPTVVPTTPMADKSVPTANGAAMQFTSYDLGITFSYPKKGVTVKRIGMKVFVTPTGTNTTDGQYVEVFTKDSAVTLAQVLQASFLAGYNAKNCFTTDVTKKYTYPAAYEVKTINTPTPKDMEDLDKKVALCPQPYTQSNGIAFFLASSIRMDRYAYVSIGQYSIAGKTSSDTWQETLRFIAP